MQCAVAFVCAAHTERSRHLVRHIRPGHTCIRAFKSALRTHVDTCVERGAHQQPPSSCSGGSAAATARRAFIVAEKRCHPRVNIYIYIYTHMRIYAFEYICIRTVQCAPLNCTQTERVSEGAMRCELCCNSVGRVCESRVGSRSTGTHTLEQAHAHVTRAKVTTSTRFVTHTHT